jgi:hypothetical protein
MRYASRIDAAISDLDRGQDIEQVDYSDPELCAVIKQLHDFLAPHLRNIEWWGEYCDSPEALDQVMEAYQQDPRLKKYPGLIELEGKQGVYSNKYHWMYHELEYFKQCTESWGKLSEDERREVIAKSRRTELRYWYGHNQHESAVHPVIPIEQYEELQRLIETWDGTATELDRILSKAGIDRRKYDRARVAA